MGSKAKPKAKTKSQNKMVGWAEFAKPNISDHCWASLHSVQPTKLLALAFAVAFDSVCPLSVAELLRVCQGKSAMDGRFSRNEPGWRIEAALKQARNSEGSRRPTRPGCIFLVTSFVQAKEVTRQQAKKGFSKTEKISVNNFNHQQYKIQQSLPASDTLNSQNSFVIRDALWKT